MSNPQSPSTGLAFLAACGAGVLWGTGALVVNILVARHGFTPENISFWRFVVGGGVLMAVFGWNISWGRLRPLMGTVLVAGVAMAGYVLLWFMGIEQMGAAVPTLIALCLPPVIVTAWAVARRQERADVQLFLVLIGSIAGTVLIVAQHGPQGPAGSSGAALLGVAFSIGSALLYAGFSMISWGAARLKPTALTVATLLEVLTAVVLSALLLDQRLGALQWLGGTLLLLSIWFLGRRSAARP